MLPGQHLRLTKTVGVGFWAGEFGRLGVCMSADIGESSSRSRIPYGPVPQQFGELTVPPGAGPHPVVAFIHGGFWRDRYGLDLAEPQAVDVAANGWATWNIEYRRVGHPGGGYPGTLTDVADAIDHLHEIADEHRIDTERVALVGHSAGGHLALWVGQRSRLPADSDWNLPRVKPRLVVGQAAVSDLASAAADGLGSGAVVAMMGGGPNAVPERYDIADPARLLPVDVPQLIVHGSADDDVPLALSRAYARLADSERVDLVEFAGADHFDMIDPSHDSWNVVKRRISRLLSV